MSSLLARSSSRLATTLQFWNNPVVRVNAVKQVFACTHLRCSSSLSPPNNINNENDDDGYGLGGDLFHSDVGPDLLGRSAYIRRTFDPRSNSLSLLTCGGQKLAKHASFDPEYKRARHWIRHHAVGPAVLSPVLINGLVGALVEASVPQSIPISSSMKQIRPLIVGVEVTARIEVVDVCDGENTKGCDSSSSSTPEESVREVYERKGGYEVQLKTEVTRMRDGAAIAEGTHTIFVPDYLHM